MEAKHLKIFAGIFLFLFIIFFITKPRHAGVNIDDFVQNIIIGISKNDIKTVEVYKETSAEQPIQMIFTKSGEDESRWMIPTNINCNAQKSTIDRLLDDLLEMTGKVRSSDPKHFDTYYISDEQGIHLLLKDAADKTLANMIIGKKAEDFNAGFIRFMGKEKVYSVDKNILSSLNIHGNIDTLSNFNLTSFIDLQAVNQDEEKLETVMLVAGNKKVTINKVEKEIEFVAEDSSKATRIENRWVLVKGNEETDIRQKKIDDFFRDVAKIRANEVIDRIGNTFQDMNKSSRYGFQRPSHYIVFKSPDSAQQNVIIGKEYEKGEGYYLYVQYDGLVYKLNKSTYDSVFKWIDELPEKVKG